MAVGLLSQNQIKQVGKKESSATKHEAYSHELCNQKSFHTQALSPWDASELLFEAHVVWNCLLHVGINCDEPAVLRHPLVDPGITLP